MSNWKRYKIRETGRVITGYTPSTKVESLWLGDIPFYSPSDINGKSICVTTERTVSQGAIIPNRYVPKGSVLITCIGSLGKIVIAGADGITNQQINSLICNNNFDCFFSYYLLAYNKLVIENLSGITTIPIVNKDTFERIEFLYPLLPEQQKIAKILQTIDGQIEKTEVIIAKYKAIKQGLMQDLFTRGIDATTGKLRPHYLDAPELYKDSPLGMIPKEWEIKKLGHLIAAIDPQPDHRTPPAVDGGVPYIGISDFLASGEIDIQNCRKVGMNVLSKQKSSFTIYSGDIIFGKIGTIGKPKVLPDFPKQNFTLSANVILIKPFETPKFIYWSIVSEYVENQVSLAINLTSQAAFGMEKIRGLDILVPPLKERNMITKRLNKLEDLVNQEEITFSKLKQLKKGLMSDLLSGKVRVKVNEKAVC